MHRLPTTSPIFFSLTSRRTILTWTQSRCGQGKTAATRVLRFCALSIDVNSHHHCPSLHLGSDSRAGRIRGRCDDRFPRRASHHSGMTPVRVFFCGIKVLVKLSCHTPCRVPFRIQVCDELWIIKDKKVHLSKGRVEHAMRQGRVSRKTPVAEHLTLFLCDTFRRQF